ncbi:hypothetical protein PLEOSDRAFT_1110060 [Pleurotus ostreatus PC15]|uniref:Uncharacterized protein n=1 Tax=Pleurotus ostreatus (strain PC15) TaxID=1137138 RepID=A0A067NGU1_PLEO1|nr:hypothetical protein PLEOSDRAFT_1110060 [Pleurotus ostreatus PC15]
MTRRAQRLLRVTNNSNALAHDQVRPICYAYLLCVTLGTCSTYASLHPFAAFCTPLLLDSRLSTRTFASSLSSLLGTFLTIINASIPTPSFPLSLHPSLPDILDLRTPELELEIGDSPSSDESRYPRHPRNPLVLHLVHHASTSSPSLLKQAPTPGPVVPRSRATRPALPLTRRPTSDA